MATLVGVALPAPVAPEVLRQLPSLGVVLEEPPAAGGLFIGIDGWDTRPAETLAAALSEVASGPVFAVLAQTSADAYGISEYTAGKSMRQLRFSRDYGGWSPPIGDARAWEADFHFALPLDDLLDALGDDDAWSDEDLEAARSAHSARRLDQLPRLPDPSGHQIEAFLKTLGVELSARASFRKPGLFQRLFGRDRR